MQFNTLIGLLGNGFRTISTKAALAFLKQYDSSISFYALKGGNDQLPQAFADRLNGHILFNLRVQRVEQLKEKCLLECAKNGETIFFEAKKVVFAIPLPALHKIEISPPLSIEKQKLIQNIFYTKCARMTIVAPPTTLSPAPQGGCFLTSRLGWFRDESAFQKDPYKKTVISVNTAGENARELFSSIDRINDILSKISQNWDPRQAEYHTHFWNEGYSYFPPGIFEQLSYLEQPEGNFHFAGEGTVPENASMNAALRSGIRAAKEILQDIGVEIRPDV